MFEQTTYHRLVFVDTQMKGETWEEPRHGQVGREPAIMRRMKKVDGFLRPNFDSLFVFVNVIRDATLTVPAQRWLGVMGGCSVPERGWWFGLTAEAKTFANLRGRRAMGSGRLDAFCF